MPKPCPKVKFSNPESAQFHIDKNKERNDAKGLVARVYLCPCGSYHITSKPTFHETEAMWMRFTEWAAMSSYRYVRGMGWINHGSTEYLSTAQLFTVFKIINNE